MAGSTSFIEGTLVIAFLTLKYGGLTTMLLGFMRWALAKNSTEASKQGYWMMLSGTFMFMVYLGWNIFRNLALWYINSGP